MKKFVFFSIFVALAAGFAFWGCKDSHEEVSQVITSDTTVMTTDAGVQAVSIAIGGAGKMAIDWGDGTQDGSVISTSPLKNYSHSYSGSSAHTVTIVGDHITQLSCSGNRLTGLDVSKNTALTYLNCSDSQLISLDVSKNIALTDLTCYNNQLTSLDVSKNTALTYFSCYNNQLTSLDVSNNISLTYLDCGTNQLSSLDMSKNTALTKLYCYDNQLTGLDVGANAALAYLSCYSNQITSLDVSKNTALANLNCSVNQLTDSALDALFTTLNVSPGTKTIYISDNPGTAYCDQKIATAKGWTVNVTN